MKRSTQMKRTGFAKAAFKAPSKLPEEPQPPKIRTRKCAIKTCRKPFPPRSMSHKCCSPECAQEHVLVEKAKKDRQDRQKGLQALKTKRDYIKECQVGFNAYIRARDAHQPCISCGRSLQAEAIGGGYDCGHYRSIGSAPHLRFNEDNAHGQCKKCNRYDSGRAVDYRIGLIARIGLSRVESLEADSSSPKWTIDDLLSLRDHYRRVLRELKKNKQEVLL